MKKVALLLGTLLFVGCIAEAEPDPETSIVAEELKGGVYVGGPGGFGLNPYGDCLTDCSHLKAACERRNLQIITSSHELAEPCDLEYSICKARCDRTFPQ